MNLAHALYVPTPRSEKQSASRGSVCCWRHTSVRGGNAVLLGFDDAEVKRLDLFDELKLAAEPKRIGHSIRDCPSQLPPGGRCSEPS